MASTLRELSEDLFNILPACKIRQTVDIYLANNTALHLSRGLVYRTISSTLVEYANKLKSISEQRRSLTTSIDRLTVTCENIEPSLGLNLASSLRLFDYAFARVGRQFQANRNNILIEDIPDEFFGICSTATASTDEFQFEIIVDYEALGNVVGSRGLSPRCWWTYKNGIECTSTSTLPDCEKTRQACKLRGKEWEFGGWEFWQNPVVSVPGSGTNDGDIGGSGSDGSSCFTLDTKIGLLSKDLPIGELPLGECKIPCYSFNPKTEQIEVDEIIEVFEHEVTGYFTFTFSDGSEINATPEHPFFVGNNKFINADDLQTSQFLKKTFNFNHLYNSKIYQIKWNSDEKVTVRNCRVKKNQTYFANQVAVHNKGIGDILVGGDY